MLIRPRSFASQGSAGPSDASADFFAAAFSAASRASDLACDVCDSRAADPPPPPPRSFAAARAEAEASGWRIVPDILRVSLPASSTASSIIPSTMAPSLFPARYIPRLPIVSGRSSSTLVSAACFTRSVASYTCASRSLLVYCSAHDSYTSSPLAGASEYSKFADQ